MDENCAHPAPICDMGDHRCKCLEDTDCEAGEKCDNGLCVTDVCLVDGDCGGDLICNEAHDNCFWCGGDDCDELDADPVNGCCPGKIFVFIILTGF